MNHLKELTRLNNRYYFLRHGESEANAAGIINSDPAKALSDYGLTAKGKKQVAQSVRQAQLKGWLDDKTIIYSSDFKRTIETAEIAREVLGVSKVNLNSALRERHFGNWEGKRDINYIKILARDKRGLSQHKDGVESVFEVSSRITHFIRELEARYEGKTILLVSHGDPLHILEMAFKKVKPTKHRVMDAIKKAEIKQVKL